MAGVETRPEQIEVLLGYQCCRSICRAPRRIQESTTYFGQITSGRAAIDFFYEVRPPEPSLQLAVETLGNTPSTKRHFMSELPSRDCHSLEGSSFAAVVG